MSKGQLMALLTLECVRPKYIYTDTVCAAPLPLIWNMTYDFYPIIQGQKIFEFNLSTLNYRPIFHDQN